ncbi:MAG: metal ABC transporter substrate-binding protein [Chloroflexota bacterium]
MKLFVEKRLLLLIFSLMLAVSLVLVGCDQAETAEPAAEPVAEVDQHSDDHQNDDHHDDDHHDDESDHHDDDPHHDDDDDHHDNDGDHHDDDDHHHDEDDDHHDDAEMLALPALAAIDLGDGKLRVVATTSIIGDIVSRVGGDAIELTILMGPGVDAHSYQASAAELTAVADAHVVFINGWDLEEGLIHDLENIAEGIPLVPVSANIKPLAFAEDDDGHDDAHDHEADPHTWFNPHLVEQWVENIEHALHDLDPANEELYEANAAAYLEELEELIAYIEARVAEIPVERRKLVTNHDTFGYFAQEYGFEVVGTIIPSVSTVAEPSARELAQLVDRMQAEGVCTIFTESVASEQLARAVTEELTDCAEVQVLRLFTDAVGEAGSGAETYLDMMRINIDTIVTGLVQ